MAADAREFYVHWKTANANFDFLPGRSHACLVPGCASPIFLSVACYRIAIEHATSVEQPHGEKRRTRGRPAEISGQALLHPGLQRLSRPFSRRDGCGHDLRGAGIKTVQDCFAKRPAMAHRSSSEAPFGGRTGSLDRGESLASRSQFQQL